MTDINGTPQPLYQPVACALHDVYELAILRRQQLRLVYVEGNVFYEEVVMPMDLQTHQGEEFLLAHSPTRAALKIRLDYIRQASPISSPI